MSRRRDNKGWAIVDASGRLYTNTVGSERRGAIAYHVAWHCAAGRPQPSQFAFRKLDALQRERWARCKRSGDRAVKVEISWSKP